MATKTKTAAKKASPKAAPIADQAKAPKAIAQKAKLLPAKEEEKVTTAWNKGITMTLHAVKVGGKTYKSTWQAWQALKAGSRGQCIRFRKELKKAGKATWTTGEGKKIEFQTIKPSVD